MFFRLLLTAILVSATVLGCAHPVQDFTFEAGGRMVALNADSRVPKGAQGEFLPGTTDGLRTALFGLKQPVAVANRTKSFSLTYTAQGSAIALHVFLTDPQTKQSREMTAILPVLSKPEPVTFLLPLPDGTDVNKFRITSTDQNATVHVHAAALVPDYPGVRLGTGNLLIRDGVGLKESLDGSQTTYELSFAKLLKGLGTGQAQLALKYSYSGSGADIHITVGDGTNTRQFSLYPQDGNHTLYFYTASVGINPEQITLVSAASGFSVESVEARPFGGGSSPVPANFGTILTYSPDHWRQKDYEVFSWSLAPSVLVFDFRTLAVQSKYLKRLAYFVEKAGYAGKLWPNYVISPLHGWNAHDYRPKDLAAFFTMAQSQHFPLNPEEISLQDILVANGIIVRTADGFAAGKGAIIGFSQNDPYWLRYILLTHEGYHGIYFTHPGYRDAVHRIWNALPAQQQKFFRIFLGRREYNAKDDYLVINEFQAYLMQQRVDEVKKYYRGRVLASLSKDLDFKNAALGEYVKAHPDMFVSMARSVQDAVHAAAGVNAGELVALVPKVR